MQQDQKKGMEKDLKLLMAEDNEINRKLASMLFKRHNLSVDFAKDGGEAIDMCLAHVYDLVLMDIEMPGVDGLEATSVIKEKMGAKAPPIVALTAHNLDGQAEEFMAQGMDGFLTKPIKIEEMFSLFQRLKA